MTDHIKPIHSVRKFYLLEYFYVLLSSIEKYYDKEQVFNSFKELKLEYRLGESKYKKLTLENESPTEKQLSRYRYTFDQLVDEASDYNLIKVDKNSYYLTDQGEELLKKYRSKRINDFNHTLFQLMEERYNAFRYLVNFLYDSNRFKPGFLIFPFYSPRQLDFDKSKVKTTSDIVEYSKRLVLQLKKDIIMYLGEPKYHEFNKKLDIENEKFVKKLIENNILPASDSKEFDPSKYNVITKRFRDFWITYFLREIYKFQFSMATFDIWVYRGKQIGIIQATEFYPSFNGRIVYPTSVIMKSVQNEDFKKLYDYGDGNSLYIHLPNLDENNQNKFVDYLVKGYFELRRPFQGNFISLTALRELVCFNMKISDYLFQDFLEEIYRLNIIGELRIRISLEVDKLPEETKAIYIKREPVMIDGKYRNIIAIDVTKEDSK